jgi:hypothetical protein
MMEHNLPYGLFNRLDLDMWINDPPSESSEDENLAGVGARDIFVRADNMTDGIGGGSNHNKQPELTEEELERVSVSGSVFTQCSSIVMQ